MKKYNLPEWVEKYKEKGKTIKVKNSNYYLYESKCVYDKNKKNKHYTKDIYLGRITEDNGFIPAKKIIILNQRIFILKFMVVMFYLIV